MFSQSGCLDMDNDIVIHHSKWYRHRYIDIDIDLDDGDNNDNDNNNDKQPTIATINLWMTWAGVGKDMCQIPRAMIFWFLSIEKRTNQISQSWERMLNDLYVSKSDSKPWSQSYGWLWLYSLPSSGPVLQTKVSSRQDRPEGVVNVKCVPFFCEPLKMVIPISCLHFQK